MIKYIDEISGWLSHDEGDTLTNLASQVGDYHVIVELGSYEGRSTCCLALGTMNGFNRPVYAVDLWDKGGQWETDVARREGEPLHHDDPKHYHAFVVNTAPYSARIIEVHKHSHEAGEEWKGGQTVGLLFIDAGHSYDDVMGDLVNWSDHVVKDGWICIHDYTNTDYPDIKRAVDDWLGFWPPSAEIVDSMLVLRKCAT